jgi:serine/threonine protein kinase/predicted MPP superfamily phosphohydrolase
LSTITWLHISDLHFQTSQAYDANVVLQALLKDVAKHVSLDRLRPDFIAITGDIAFSGKSDEYDLARRFFDDLLRITGLEKDRLFLVPGNHDVDRDLVSPGAESIGDSLRNRDSVNDILSNASDRCVMFGRYQGYADFVNGYLGEHLLFDQEDYFYVRKLQVGGRCVAVMGLNSAWLSASDEDEAKRLVLGELQVREALAQAEGADLTIALVHHPFEFLRPFDRDDSAAMLIDHCSFVLHGHLHHAVEGRLGSPDSQAMILSGGACYETQDYPNTYNWVQIGLAAGSGMVYLRRYSDKRGGFWAKDTLSYKSVSSGRYGFQFALGKAGTDADTFHAGQVILGGKYRVRRCIGTGGMASVWQAEEPELGERPVAIKVPLLKKVRSQELEARFWQEIRLMPKLRDVRNVVQVYTLEHLRDGTPLLVMEYAQGGPLVDLIAHNPDGLPVDKALSITRDILKALGGLHRLSGRPVHRDVKPANILLNSGQRALLSDFGLTQLRDATFPSRFMDKPHPGTPFYMAPEQVRSTAPLTPAADLYALGCVLFEMLTGRRYRDVRPGIRPSELRPDLPRWLDRVLSKALAIEPSERYQDAEEMLLALEPPSRRWFSWMAIGGGSLLLSIAACWLVLHLLRGVVPPLARSTATALPTASFNASLLISTRLPDPSPVPTLTNTPPPTVTSSPTPTLAPTWTSIPTATPLPPTPTATPRASPRSGGGGFAPAPAGRIAFPVFDGKRRMYDIYVAASANGWQPELLVSNASQPAYSPDGTYLAYRNWRSDQRGLWSSRSDGSQATWVTRQFSAEDAVPRWRTVDREVVYCRRGSGMLPKLYHVWGLGGGEPQQIRPGAQELFGESPDWLTDTRIVYREFLPSGDRRGLSVIDANGYALQHLTNEPCDTAPAASPRGDRIAFMSEGRDGNWEVYVIKADGSGLTNLSQHDAHDGLPTWSPDGRYVAFVSNRGGTWAVWAVSADGGQVQKLVTIGQLHGTPYNDDSQSTRGWIDESISWTR